MDKAEVVCELSASWDRSPSGLTPAQRLSLRSAVAADRLRQWKWHAANGVVECFEHKGKVQAIFFYAPSENPPVKGHEAISFRFDPKHSRAAKAWLRSRLRFHHTAFHDKTELRLRADQVELLPFLRRLGFGDKFQVIEGETELALRGLLRAKKPPRDLGHLGLEIRVLRARDVPALVHLQKKVFSRAARHGYYSHSARQLANDRREYLAMAKNPKLGLLYGVWRERKLLGMFAFSVNPHPMHGKMGGFSLIFDPSIQGLGIAKTAYRVMLEEIRRRGVRKFMGGTSQPAVLALGKVMKRKTIAYILQFAADL